MRNNNLCRIWRRKRNVYYVRCIGINHDTIVEHEGFAPTFIYRSPLSAAIPCTDKTDNIWVINVRDIINIVKRSEDE